MLVGSRQAGECALVADRGVAFDDWLAAEIAAQGFGWAADLSVAITGVDRCKAEEVSVAQLNEGVVAPNEDELSRAADIFSRHAFWQAGLGTRAADTAAAR